MYILYVQDRIPCSPYRTEKNTFSIQSLQATLAVQHPGYIGYKQRSLSIQCISLMFKVISVKVTNSHETHAAEAETDILLIYEHHEDC